MMLSAFNKWRQTRRRIKLTRVITRAIMDALSDASPAFMDAKILIDSEQLKEVISAACVASGREIRASLYSGMITFYDDGFSGDV